MVGFFMLIFFFEKSKEEKRSGLYDFPDLYYFPEMPRAVDNPVTYQGLSLGRYLFYDPVLSKNQSISCATCHQQAVAFSDAPIALSKGINGKSMTRNTMPLFNLAWYSSMFWDGRSASIEEQVFHPVRAHNEMNLNWNIATARIQKSKFYKARFKKAFGNIEIDSVLIAKAIAQFERTLISYNSKYDQVIRGETFFTPDEYEGFVLMNDQTKGDCLHCHTTDANVLGTTGGFSNNGLDKTTTIDDYLDQGRGAVIKQEDQSGWFKIPSLRNISVTAPYMHDGRFETLEEVLDFYSEGLKSSYNIDSKMRYVHQGGAQLSKDEKKKIISFLHTLTDSTFLTDPAFSNPFK